MNSKNKIFIVSHGPTPRYRVVGDASLIWLSSEPAPQNTGLKIIDGYSFFTAPEQLHDYLSGSLGTLAIKNWMNANGTGYSNITVWQYRKFVSLDKKMGSRAPNYRGMRIIRPQTCPDLIDPLLKSEIKFILSGKLKFKSVLQQYFKRHNLDDLLLFSAAAIRSGAMKRQDVLEILNQRIFIPGGIELGTYPIRFWMETVQKLEAIVYFFIEHFELTDSIDPVQRRALSFCMERFGSYFILKSGFQNTIFDKTMMFGSMYLVDEATKYHAGI